MATIKFKAKVQGDGNIRHIIVPKFTRSHCDMPAFRKHRRWGGIANSDLFPGVLARIRRDLVGNGGFIDANNPPPNVDIDDSGFLAVVTITVGE